MSEVISHLGKRHCWKRHAVAALVAVSMGSASPVRAEPEWEIAFYDDVRIEVAAEGKGPLVVMLPSRGRGARSGNTRCAIRAGGACETCGTRNASGTRCACNAGRTRGAGETGGALDAL